MPQPFYYGGQALIEGVLIRGRRHVRMAVRRPDGGIWTGPLPLSPLTSGWLRRVPLVRGVLVLAEALIIGVRGLNRSAEIAMADPDAPPVPDGEAPAIGRGERAGMAVSMGFALVLGVGVFFLLPLFGARSFNSYFDSALLSVLLEGALRLALLIGYIWAIGHMADVKRVFAYHGAEHMTIHAYEHGVPLTPEAIRAFPTAHPRCGTAFLLTVALVSVVAFAVVELWEPTFVWAVLSRIVLIPVIAAVSYEFLRFSGAHAERPWAQALTWPGLALQRLTTRQPDTAQIEVAVVAMRSALAADGAPEPGAAPGADTGHDGPLRTPPEERPSAAGEAS